MPVVQPSRSSRTAILRGRRSAVRQRQQEQYRIQQPLQQQQRPARTQPQIQPERLEQQQYQQQQQNQPKIQRQQQQQQQQEQQQQQRRQQQTKATLPITDCIVTLGRFDTNKDLVVTRTEFADVLDAWECSIYAADWDGAFGAAACTCRDYDVSTCCDDGNANDNENSDNDAATSPGAVIHRPGKYPSQYTFDVCALLASVVDTQCDNPLNRVTPFPTSAPADFIVPETTMAPTPFRSSSGGDDNRDVDVAVVDNDGVSTTSWIVAVSSVAVIAFCCGVCCAANGFRRRRHRRYQQQWWRNDFSKNTHRHRSANGASFKSSSGVAKGALQRDRQLVLDRTDSTSEGPDEEQPYEYDSRRHNNDHTEKNSSEEPVRSRSPLHLFEDESDTSSEPDGTTRPSPRKFAPPSSGSEDLEYELMQSSTNSSVTSGHQPITADVAGSAAPSSSSSNSSVRSGQHFAYDFSGLLDEMQGAILQWAELPKPNSFTESEVDIDASYTTTNEEHDARSSSSPSTYGPATPPHLQQQHQNRSSSPSSDQKEDSVPTPNLDGWTDLDNVEDLAEGLMDAFPPPPPLFARTPSFDDDMNEEETKRPKPTPVAEVTVSSHNGDDKPTIVSPLSTRGMTFPDTPSSEPTEWTETFDNANTSPLRDHPQPESEEAIRSRLSSSSSFADLDTSGESDILVDASTLADPLDHHEHLDSPENLSHTSISFDDDNVYGQDYVPVAEGAAPFAGSPGKWSNASTSSGMSAAAESPSKWSNASTSSGMSAAAESPGKWSDASTSSGVSAGADSPGKWSNASTSPDISGAGSPGKWSNASTSSGKSDR